MACGVATVSTDVGGLADLPTEQCQPTAGSLAEAMRWVYPQRAQVAARQREAVRRTFSLQRWEETWARVIESLWARGLIGRARGPRPV
jgi:hypothetical protein